MTSVFVDDRYSGRHGIGRYAQEVLSRVDVPWQPLGLGGSPHAPTDAFRRLPAAASDAVVYSPGYGALVHARRQILTVHDLIHLQTPWPARAKFLAYYGGPVRRAVRRAGVVLTVSETSANAIRSWLEDDDVEIVNAGNGCSSAFVPTGPTSASDHPYVLFVGNTRRHKNLEVLLRALAGESGLRLRAVVPEAEVRAVSRMTDESGVAGRVDILSGVDDAGLAALYRGAAVTAMPSTLEGFGLPALESISCGTPVAHWTGCAAVAEIVEGRGWAVSQADDPVAWRSVLREAVASESRVDPPTGRYDWARTAATVTAVLAQASA